MKNSETLYEKSVKKVKEEIKYSKNLKEYNPFADLKLDTVTVTFNKAVESCYKRLKIQEKYKKWANASSKHDARFLDGIKHIKLTKTDYKLWSEWVNGIDKKFYEELNKITVYDSSKITNIPNEN